MALWRHGFYGFIMETGLWRPQNAHFFPLRGRVTASAVYHPHVYGQKAELHLSADPLDPCTRSKKIVFYSYLFARRREQRSGEHLDDYARDAAAEAMATSQDGGGPA